MNFFDCCAGRGEGGMQKRGPPANTMERDAPKCGVGIIFASDGQGGLLVKGFVPNSTAANGVIQDGDLLMCVDGTDVRCWPVSEIAPLMLGPPGSSVTLRFGRKIDVPLSGGLEGDESSGGERNARPPVPKLWEKGGTPRNEYAGGRDGGLSTYDITLLRGQISTPGSQGAGKPGGAGSFNNKSAPVGAKPMPASSGRV